jgi:dipeptidyl aminopeptidase/acylaminoacyl peptidase
MGAYAVSAFRRVKSPWRPFCVALCVAPLRSTAQSVADEPLPVREALATREIAGAPIDLSADGRWVAYTVNDPRRRTQNVGVEGGTSIYLPSGALLQEAGSDVWVADTRSGATINVTKGLGTSWGGVWSPDGRQLAFYSDRGGAAHLWTWNRATGQLQEFRDVLVHTVIGSDVAHWMRDGRILVRIAPSGLSTKEAIRLGETGASGGSKGLPNRPSIMVYWSPAQSHDETQKSASGASPPADWTVTYRADLALVNPSSGAVRRIVAGERPVSAWLSPDEKHLAYVALQHANATGQATVRFDLRVASVVDGRVSTLVGDMPAEDMIGATWGPESRSLAYTTSGEGSTGNCFVVDLAGKVRRTTNGPHGPLCEGDKAPIWDAAGKYQYAIARDTLWRIDVYADTAIPWWTMGGQQLTDLVSVDHGRLIWSPDSGRSVILWIRDSADKRVGMVRLDLGRRSVDNRRVEAKSYKEADDYTAVAGNLLLYVASDAAHPPDLWATEFGLTNPRQLTHTNKELERHHLGQSELVSWRTAAGELLHGALLLPANRQAGKRYPLVVDIYGSAINRSNSVYRFGLYDDSFFNRQLFATRDIAVLQPDAPVRPGTQIQDLASDILPALDTLVAMGVVDSTKIGVMGQSYGGYSALALATASRRFRLVVSSAGQADLIAHYGILSTEGRSYGVAWNDVPAHGGMVGTPWTERDHFINNSPFFFLDRLDAAVLLLQGTNDGAVPAFLSDQVFVALRVLGKEVCYAKYRGEDHAPSLWSYANQLDYATRFVNWFVDHFSARRSPETSGLCPAPMSYGSQVSSVMLDR